MTANKYSKYVKSLKEKEVHTAEALSLLYLGGMKPDLLISLADEKTHVSVVGDSEEKLNSLKLSIKPQNEDVIERLHFVHKDQFFNLAESISYDGIVIENYPVNELFIENIYKLLRRDGELIIFSSQFNEQNAGMPLTEAAGVIELLQPYFEPESISLSEEEIVIRSLKRSEIIISSQPNWIGLFKSFVQEFEKKNAYYLSAQKEYIDTKNSLDSVLKQISDLAALSKIDQQEYKKLKDREDALRTQFAVYEKALLESLDNREMNLKAIREKISKLENSPRLLIGSYIQNSFKNPIRFPRESYKFARSVAGKIKRKIKGQKGRQKLVDLPYPEIEVPVSPLSPYAAASTAGDLNELFLIGRYDSPESLKELRVACILDDFSYQSFRNDCKMITFRPDNWREIFSKELPQILLVESAWRGNKGSWQYKIGKYQTDQGNELQELLAYCRKHYIPTVFWNKEDPIHYNKFIDTASLFDFIYTTDENCIDIYKKKVKHDRVYALPFAAQPSIHNPIKVQHYKSKNICFAGSYYANRHEDRRRDQEEILDAARPFGLDIFDRNYMQEDQPEMQFPERFKEHILGSLPYEELVKSYKQYKMFINVNSVQNSRTMFSRRVFELLACGTTVISTYAKGINEMFHSLVLMPDEENSLEDLIKKTLGNETLRYENELKGQRLIYNQHTYAHRLYNIAKNAGFNLPVPYQHEVHVLALLESVESIKNCLTMFYAQSYLNKKLIIYTNLDIDQLKEDSSPDVAFYPIQPNRDMEEIIQNNSASAEILCFYSEKNIYGKYFLEDSVHSFIYSGADLVGKAAFYKKDFSVDNLMNSRLENVFTNEVAENSYLIKKDSAAYFGISLTDMLLSTFEAKVYFDFGLRIYSSNKYNFILHADMKDNDISEYMNIISK